MPGGHLRKTPYWIGHLFLLLLITFFSIGETSQYYFYADDFAQIYQIQHNLEYVWPYVHILDFLRPIYTIFGFRPEAFFIYGIVLYFLAVMAFYFFATALTKNRFIALLSSAIYATGYIAVDQFTQIISSIQSINSIAIMIVLMIYLRYLDTRRVHFYFLTLIGYIVCINLFPVRSFPIIVFIPMLDCIFSFYTKGVSKFLRSVFWVLVRYLPFVYFSVYFGFASSTGTSTTMIGKILLRLNAKDLSEFVAITGRLFLVGSNMPWLEAIVGAVVFLSVLYIAINGLLNKDTKRYGRSLLAALGILVGGYFGFFALFPGFDSDGPASRYLAITALGNALLIPIVVFMTIKRIKWIVKRHLEIGILICVVGVIVIIMAEGSKKYTENIIISRSRPTRQFLSQLKKYIPKISGPILLYFDPSNEQMYLGQFSQILMGAFMSRDVVLASYYGVPISQIRTVVDDFTRVTDILEKITEPTQLRSFYYGTAGLVDTTQFVTDYYQRGAAPPDQITINKFYESHELEPHVEIPIPDFLSASPYMISVVMRVMPLESNRFSQKFVPVSGQDNKRLIIDYLRSRAEFQRVARVEVSSYFDNHHEEVRKAELMIDGDEKTSWVDYTKWSEGEKPWIKLDLGSVFMIDRLKWVVTTNREPKDYDVKLSVDGTNWVSVSFQSQVFKGANTRIDMFSPIQARYIHITILSTTTGESPIVAELEPIESAYSGVDLIQADKFHMDPFKYIQSQNDLTAAYAYIRINGVVELTPKTDNEDGFTQAFAQRQPVIIDKYFHTYQFHMLPQGINLEQLRVSLPFPASLEISSVKVARDIFEGFF